MKLNKKDFPEMTCDQAILEGMTSISATIHAMEQGDPQFTRKIIKILYDSQKEKAKKKELTFLNKQAEKYGFPILPTDANELERLTTGTSHGGIIAFCSDRKFPKVSDVFPQAPAHGFYVMLEGIEDPYNFGYALRSLYAAGADGIVLPERNWIGTVAGIVARSSAGASELLNIFVGNAEETVDIFKKQGYRILCAGIRNSVSLYDANLQKPLLLIIGGEKRGISAAVLKQADQIVRIVYASGFRGSLSSAATASIMGFEIMHRNTSLD